MALFTVSMAATRNNKEECLFDVDNGTLKCSVNERKRHYMVLGNVAMVEGGIMHELKARPLLHMRLLCPRLLLHSPSALTP